MSLFTDLCFVFFDVETTGLYPPDDRICEVALLTVKEGRETNSFETLIDPEREVSPGAFAVNGITKKMLTGKPLFSQVARRVLDMLSEGVIVCHNAPFDLGFLSSELERLGLPPPSGPVIDTLALARRCFRFPSNSLGNIARSMGLPLDNEHRAMSDVHTTRYVLEKLLGNLHWRGVKTLDEILTIQAAPRRKRRRRFLRTYTLPPQLEEAVRAQRPLRLVYASPNGKRTQRVVVPKEIQEKGPHLYLVALCKLRGEERSFRLDRIISIMDIDS